MILYEASQQLASRSGPNANAPFLHGRWPGQFVQAPQFIPVRIRAYGKPR
ncbi:MAG TPA: hypothetical protein VK348_08880 [Planctomycetota bacterium]|nr:hypothetical protein [Planctomycetota bacterium]